MLSTSTPAQVFASQAGEVGRPGLLVAVGMGAMGKQRRYLPDHNQGGSGKYRHLFEPQFSQLQNGHPCPTLSHKVNCNRIFKTVKASRDLGTWPSLSHL